MRMNRSQGRRPRQASGIAVSVKKCLDCELIFSDPRPKPALLSDHYGVPPESYWTQPAQWEVPDWYFAAEIAQAKQLLGFREDITALDIGAGLGKAMTAMRRSGFDVYGIEPSEQFRAKAMERMASPPTACSSQESRTRSLPPRDSTSSPSGPFSNTCKNRRWPSRCGS